MPRKPRVDYPGAWHHVMNRGVAKRMVFYTPLDKRLFLALTAREVRRERLEVHAFCILGTHFHLLVRSPRGRMSAAMQSIESEYVRWFNDTRGRDGSLFRGRFHSILVEDQPFYRKNLVRYFDRNPVDARIVDRPSDYPYCTAHHWQARTPAPWLARDWIEYELSSAGRLPTPEAYEHVFGADDEPSSIPAAGDPDTLPEDVEQEMRRRERVADGAPDVSRPCDPEEALQRLRNLDAETLQRLVGSGRRRRHRVVDLLSATLLRTACKLSYQQIGELTDCSAAAAYRRFQAHLTALSSDPDYVEVARRALNET